MDSIVHTHTHIHTYKNIYIFYIYPLTLFRMVARCAPDSEDENSATDRPPNSDRSRYSLEKEENKINLSSFFFPLYSSLLITHLCVASTDAVKTSVRCKPSENSRCSNTKGWMINQRKTVRRHTHTYTHTHFY